MPWGILLCRRWSYGLGLPCSSREARAMHAPRQEVTGGHDGPKGGGARQSSGEFGLETERHTPAGPVCLLVRRAKLGFVSQG
jgi:hypothetical protein